MSFGLELESCFFIVYTTGNENIKETNDMLTENRNWWYIANGTFASTKINERVAMNAIQHNAIYYYYFYASVKVVCAARKA